MIKKFKNEMSKELAEELKVTELEAKKYVNIFLKSLRDGFLTGLGVGFIITLLIYIFIIK